MSLSSLTRDGFGFSSIGLITRDGFGQIPSFLDTHDGADAGHFVKQPHILKLKLPKGQHLFGTWTRRRLQLPKEEQLILEEVKRIAKEIKDAKAAPPSKPELELGTRSQADYLNQQIEEFEKLQEQLLKIENAIELQRSQIEKKRLTEQEKLKYEFLLDEENRILELNQKLAAKIKDLNDEEEVALMFLLSHYYVYRL